MNGQSPLSNWAGFEPIEDNELFRFGLNPERAVLLMVRKPGGRVRAAEVIIMLRGISAMLDDSSRWSVLFDSRDAVGRNDPEFEGETKRIRAHLLDNFQRLAIIVRSAAGVMQVRRLSNNLSNTRVAVFREPARALAFASGRLRDPH